MVHLRVLRKIHLGHRKHHPLARRRDLRIAHPLHELQIRKRHRPLTRRISYALRRSRNPRTSARRSQQTRGNQSIHHGASLTPATENTAASVIIGVKPVSGLSPPLSVRPKIYFKKYNKQSTTKITNQEPHKS